MFSRFSYLVLNWRLEVVCVTYETCSPVFHALLMNITIALWYKVGGGVDKHRGLKILLLSSRLDIRFFELLLHIDAAYSRQASEGIRRRVDSSEF